MQPQQRHLHPLHDLPLEGPVAAALGLVGDLVRDVQPLQDPPERRVGPVEVRAVGEDDEELGAGGVPVVRAGHGHDPPRVFDGVLEAVGLELGDRGTTEGHGEGRRRGRGGGAAAGL